MAEVISGITYGVQDGKELQLTLVMPYNKKKVYPLVVFIQGSGWTFPNVGLNLPHLGDIAREGMVVATVTHRNVNDGYPAPAFLRDVKSAIRFLRAHAEEYHIDPERVAAYGTSSGGNTALLLGLTGDDERYKNDIYPQQSDSVCLVAECFGPTHMADLFRPEKSEDNTYYERILGCAWNTEEGRAASEAISPLCLVKEGMNLPPMLLLYGDADPVVPYEQGERMYHRLCQVGCHAEMVRVAGAEHEGNFWSKEVCMEIQQYLKKHLLAE